MVKIKFPKGANGEKQALEFITNDVVKQAEYGLISPHIPKLIRQGFAAIKEAPYPVGKYENYLFTFSTSENEDEDDASDKSEHDDELVKRLAVTPIYEMRVDYRKTCFRAIYFPIIHNEQQYYCFTHAFFKTKVPFYDPTNKYRDKAKGLYELMRMNPQIADELLNDD